MTEYIVIDDCGTTSNEVFYDLASARAARKRVLAEDGQHLSDHIHVAILNYIPEPGAWKVTFPAEDTVVYYKDSDRDTVDRFWDMGMLEIEPEWIADYEWDQS